MAQHTQKTIMSTFQAMLEEMPFDKITVSALVRRCEISANTFYYHYDDIYDLLGAWLENGAHIFVEDVGLDAELDELLRTTLQRCRDNRAIVYHIFNSLSRERLEQFAFDTSNSIFLPILRRYMADVPIPDEKLGRLAEFCDYALLGSFLRFLWNKMNDDIDELVDDLVELIHDLIDTEIAKYRNEDR